MLRFGGDMLQSLRRITPPAPPACRQYRRRAAEAPEAQHVPGLLRRGAQAVLGEDPRHERWGHWQALPAVAALQPINAAGRELRVFDKRQQRTLAGGVPPRAARARAGRPSPRQA
jgi:hypothetical protein